MLISLLTWSIIQLCKSNTKYNNDVSRILIIIGLIQSILLLLWHIDIKEEIIFNNFLKINQDRNIVEILFLTTTIILLFNKFHNRDNKITNDKLTTLMYLIFGGSLVIYSNDLIITFIGIECISYSIYILISLKQSSTTSTKSSIKYFLISCIASVFLLLGIILTYKEFGYTNISLLQLTINNNMNINIQLIKGLLIIPLLIKIGIVPFHRWSIDVYDASDTYWSAWLNTIPKICYIITIKEFININSNNNILILLLFISTISLIIGSIIGLKQNLLKRLISYSSINQISYIIIITIILKLSHEEDNYLFLYLIIIYIISNTLFWILLFTFDNNNLNHDNLKLNNMKSYILIKKNEIRQIKELSLLDKKNIGLKWYLTISILSLAGIPPFMGFFSKLELLQKNIFNLNYSIIYYIFIILIIMSSIISTIFYLRIIKYLWFYKDDFIIKSYNTTNWFNNQKINHNNFSLSFISIIILLFPIMEYLTLNWIHN